MGELIKNGGFEETGVFSAFAHWEDLTSNVIIHPSATPGYEGAQNALFATEITEVLTTKTAVISQKVAVSPGNYLCLGFADNLFRAGTGFDGIQVRARVFYRDNCEVDLINIEMSYCDGQADRGFTFHQRMSADPVPLNIYCVTVEFFVQVRDLGDPNSTVWLLDGVSLRGFN